MVNLPFGTEALTDPPFKTAILAGPHELFACSKFIWKSTKASAARFPVKTITEHVILSAFQN